MSKRPEDLSDIGINIDLNASPLLFIYQKEFVKRVLTLTNVDIDEETRI